MPHAPPAGGEKRRAGGRGRGAGRGGGEAGAEAGAEEGGAAGLELAVYGGGVDSRRGVGVTGRVGFKKSGVPNTEPNSL